MVTHRGSATNYPEECFTRGYIWKVFPYEPRGHQQQGVRPYVICQANAGKDSNVFLMAPISRASRSKRLTFLQPIQLREQSFIHYELTGVINRDDLVKPIKRMSLEEIRAMDRYLPIPMELEMGSFLLIENIKIGSRYGTGADETFKGVITYASRKRAFTFTREKFIKELGIVHAWSLDRDFNTIESVLTTLAGLKFLYNVMTEIEYNKYAVTLEV